ncbi:hypothetical protein K488DRAFT_91798 [Vararia minispora EC-137]|uniref:Uncharacterized protein n=1 Tax=Vararia minispora EC-137 TaxID=1314806 RepID=A0ACB8Q5I1_9AGAM|nr:hypothetical protein K488DRAFT_91798 [Vararia minispora EC-137]
MLRLDQPRILTCNMCWLGHFFSLAFSLRAFAPAPRVPSLRSFCLLSPYRHYLTHPALSPPLTVHGRGETNHSDRDSESLSHPPSSARNDRRPHSRACDATELRTKIQIDAAPAYMRALVPSSSPSVTPSVRAPLFLAQSPEPLSIARALPSSEEPCVSSTSLARAGLSIFQLLTPSPSASLTGLMPMACLQSALSQSLPQTAKGICESCSPSKSAVGKRKASETGCNSSIDSILEQRNKRRRKEALETRQRHSDTADKVILAAAEVQRLKYAIIHCTCEESEKLLYEDLKEALRRLSKLNKELQQLSELPHWV